MNHSTTMLNFWWEPSVRAEEYEIVQAAEANQQRFRELGRKFLFMRTQTQPTSHKGITDFDILGWPRNFCGQHRSPMLSALL